MKIIKPSAIKSITVEIAQVLWSSIGGMDSVKRDLREAIELPLSHHEYFEQLRVPPPRGILLYGPPGCSKTLMARALAIEGNMNFLAVQGPELLSKWLGESERAFIITIPSCSDG
jgi:SpoVK/Ycf46/Vps4 family AAA+-type ATPase